MPIDRHCNNGLSVCVHAEHAVARLSLINSGWSGPHICRWVAPRNHLAGYQPPRHMHHPDSCGFSCVYSVRFVHTLHDAPNAQQASCKCCHQKDEPARPGKTHCWVVCHLLGQVRPVSVNCLYVDIEILQRPIACPCRVNLHSCLEEMFLLSLSPFLPCRQHVCGLCLYVCLYRFY